MQEFNHIEELWAQHSVDVKLSADDVLKQAKKEVNNVRLKSLLNILGMATSILGVAAIWLFYDFNSILTHIGISIIVLTIFAYTIILYTNHRVIAKNDFTENPTIFLEKLKIYQLQRHQLYNKLYWFYVIALSLGMCLYFLEILYYLPLWQQLVILTASFSWIIFCSTLLRRAVIKRDKERISLLIEKFERLSAQLKETE